MILPFCCRKFMGRFLLLALLFAASLETPYSASLQKPSGAEARFNRALELQRLGALKEAAAEYRELLKIDPQYAEAQANLGAILAQMGQYKEAVSHYQTALQLDPELKPILLNLGIAHYRASQFQDAVGELQKYLNGSPNSLQGRQLLGLSLIELGRYSEAATQLEQTLTATPSDPAVLYGLGLARLRLGRAEFGEIVQRLATEPAGVALSHLLMGQSLLAAADYRRAHEEFQAAAKLNPDVPRLGYWLGQTYMLLGRHREAIASFENELHRKPQDFWVLYYLAYLHEAQRNLDVAQRQIETALMLEPQSPEGNALLGKVLFAQKKTADALVPLEIAVAKGSADSETHYLLGRVYQKLGRREDAEREFGEARRLKEQQLEKEKAGAPKL